MGVRDLPVVGPIVALCFALPYWSWHGFGFYVWSLARRFGSQPECNTATKLIVFGRELSATGSGRVVSLGEQCPQLVRD